MVYFPGVYELQSHCDKINADYNKVVALELVHSGEVNHLFASGLMIISLVIFYLSIMVNKEYYKQNIKLTKRDVLLMMGTTIAGIAVILIFVSNLYAFLIGSLIITFGNFGVLLMKYKGRI